MRVDFCKVLLEGDVLYAKKAAITLHSAVGNAYKLN
jgi:hypothetical protein